MSYDPVDETDEPLGQQGYRLGDKETPRFGRCRAKKCICWKYIGKDAPNA